MKKIKNYLKSLKENKNLIKGNQGGISIIFVIVMFIVIIFIMGYVDIMRASFVTEEFQGIMDLAGVAALREGIDDVESFEKNADDVLIYDEGVIRSTFKRLLAEQITTNDKGPIIDYNVKSITITELNDTKWGLGVTDTARNQLVLDTIVSVIVPVSNEMFDADDGTEYKFYNQLNNTEFTVISKNKKGDNREELIIRSVTRLVK